ncbi:MAG: metal-dependent transcriptional regulator [Nitrospiraceae bacterium]|nr:metal-dependent transcriptional regulator [Nitrospiraceae bacterium]
MSTQIDKERIEEALGLIWDLHEGGHKQCGRFVINSDDPDNDLLLDVLKADGLVRIENNVIDFTPKGEAMARALIRRQRLAERLFSDVFEMPDDAVLDDACKMEHILSEELTESVCTFLGHPPTCPHGKPIPRGECCKKFRVDVAPVVTRLTDFEVGAAGRITFIVSSDPSRINRLNGLGIAAGSIIRHIQKTPSCIIQIDETTVAIDPDIAKEIYIKKVTR